MLANKAKASKVFCVQAQHICVIIGQLPTSNDIFWGEQKIRHLRSSANLLLLPISDAAAGYFCLSDVFSSLRNTLPTIGYETPDLLPKTQTLVWPPFPFYLIKYEAKTGLPQFHMEKSVSLQNRHFLWPWHNKAALRKKRKKTVIAVGWLMKKKEIIAPEII